MTIETIKFSEFVSGGDLSNDKTTVGLDSTLTINTRFNNPWTFLAPGTTGDRPVIDPVMYYRLRFNTQTRFYEFYDPIVPGWVEIEDSDSILPLLASHLPGEGASLIGLENQGTILNKTVQDLANASLVASTDNGTLVNGQFLYLLDTGIVKNTTATGILSILAGSDTITAIINDDTMATAATTNIPTALSVKNYVDSAIVSGAVLLNPAGNQTILNAFDLIMDAGSMVAPTMLPGNLSLSGNTLSSTNSNGAINFIPNGSGATQGITRFGVATNIGADTSSIIQASAIQKTGTISVMTYWNANAGSSIALSTSTSEVPGVLGAVTSSQLLGSINFRGDDGVTGLVGAADIIARTSATISSGIVPAQLEFYTANTSGARTIGMILTNDQILQLANSLNVIYGGTGRASATAYALLAGGTIATGIHQSLTTGSAGQFLTSGGASALPTWTTATFPATAGAAGTILRSNGTNFVSSTSTFADTYGASTLLYSNGANTVTGLATANNGILVTSAGGVPSIGNTVGAGLTMPSITFNSTSGIIGTTTNDSAAAGSVGQLISSVIGSGSAISISAATQTNLTSISLTAGDWDVWGNITFISSGATQTVRDFIVGVNTVSATLPDASLYSSLNYTSTGLVSGTSSGFGINAPMQRISVAGSTTIYLVGYADFTTSTFTMCGGLYARRRR